MKIAVINGSPKGNKYSVTMRYVYYVENLFPEHRFEYVDVGLKLTKMKLRKEKLKHILDVLKGSDGILWSFPIYTTLIPAQLKKFIELLFEQNTKDLLSGKYCACLSTSMKFFDHTAHNYMHAIIEDLDMRFVGFHSAKMNDLLDFEHRKNLYYFMKSFLTTIKEKRPLPRHYSPIQENNLAYRPKSVQEHKKIDIGHKKVLILTDNKDKDSNLGKMVQRFIDSLNGEVMYYDIEEIDIRGGCLGCCKCGPDNQCVYNDGFTEFFQSVYKNTDILVNAATMKDRYFSYKWKLFLDRSFHNGHTPATIGTQMCYLISGKLSQNENLRQLIKAQTQLGYANLVDIVTDEFADSERLDRLIYNMAQKAVRFAESDYTATPTFLKAGGYKIFRDMIYGMPGGIFQADYHFFKERDMFDFPTKDLKSRFIRRILLLLLKSSKLKEFFKKQILKGMITPHKKFLENLDVKEEKEKLGIESSSRNQA